MSYKEQHVPSRLEEHLLHRIASSGELLYEERETDRQRDVDNLSSCLNSGQAQAHYLDLGTITEVVFKVKADVSYVFCTIWSIVAIKISAHKRKELPSSYNLR